MGKIYLLMLALCGIFLLYGFKTRKPVLSRTNPAQKNVSITGHRGAAGLAQENTLAAIQKGLEQKCDRIEIDVHQSADSVLIIMHDDSIDRLTNGKGKIKHLTYRQLQEYKIKASKSEGSVPEKIPTLEEAIEAVKGKAILLIELKEGSDVYPGIEENVVALIRKHDAAKWCMIHSFKEKILKKVHELAPEIPLHLLLLTGLFNTLPENYITEVSVFSRLVTKSFIDKIHKAGKKINVWTVNNIDDMFYFIQIGVDGIITDFPDLANEAAIKKL